MKDILIIILLIILIITIFYLILLKRSLKKFSNDIKRKTSKQSKSLLTNDFNDKDLNVLVNTINDTLNYYDTINSDYENKNSRLRKMITNISHDLRTPLTSSLGYVDLLVNSKLNKKEKEEYLKIIDERLKRLSNLINSFFEFSKVISNDKPIEISKLNLVAVLEKAISNHYDDFSKSNRKIDFYTSNRVIEIKSNEIMLDRIFDNLIRNAYKHSNGDLKISVHILKNTIQISFINELLFSNLDVERIYDEFYTVDISRTTGNTGLGLAIVKEFTEQLNGKIYTKKENDCLNITLEFYKNTNITKV